VGVPGQITEEGKRSGESTPQGTIQDEKKVDQVRGTFGDHEAQMGETQMLETARGEVIQKPSFGEILKVCTSPQTLVLGACYFCSFGAELAINSILGTYYTANLAHLQPGLGATTPLNWAAMFGLMNALFRPLGGVVSDLLYKATGHNLWAKKTIVHAYSIIAGAFLVAIGVTNPHDLATLVCLIGVGFAFFLEGANGLVFSLVPHVHPYANGVVSGFTGASGNLGGIIFAIIFRFETHTVNRVAGVSNYAKSIWIIGVIIMCVNVAVCWIRPVPKNQIGGH